MLRHLKAASSLTLQYPRLIFFIYLINLLLGIAVAGLFYTVSVSEGNGSLVLDKLLADFDYMVFTDFMRHHGSALTPVFLAALGIVGVYFLLSNLWIGGVFYHYKIQPQQFKLRTFFHEGWRMFGKYLLILLMELFLLSLTLLLSGIFYFIFALIAEGGSEREYILWLAVPTALLIFMGSIVVVISDYAKYLLFEFKQFGIWTGFGKAVSYVFKNFQTVGLYWLVIFAGILLGLAYLGVDALIGMSGVFTVALMFIMQQLVVVGRVFLKNLNYAVIVEFHSSHPIILSEIQPPIDVLDEPIVDVEPNKPSEEE